MKPVVVEPSQLRFLLGRVVLDETSDAPTADNREKTEEQERKDHPPAYQLPDDASGIGAYGRISGDGDGFRDRNSEADRITQNSTEAPVADFTERLSEVPRFRFVADRNAHTNSS